MTRTGRVDGVLFDAYPVLTKKTKNTHFTMAFDEILKDDHANFAAVAILALQVEVYKEVGGVKTWVKLDPIAANYEVTVIADGDGNKKLIQVQLKDALVAEQKARVKFVSNEYITDAAVNKALVPSVYSTEFVYEP